MRGRQSQRARLVLSVLTFLLLLLLSAYRSSAAEAKAQEISAASYSALQAMSPETRGDLLMVRHQYLEAIDAYRQAPRDSAVVWNKLGIAYHHIYAVEQAKNAYQQALMLKPKYPEAINNLGVAVYAEKDYKRAEKLYRRALKMMPASAATYSNLGTAYFAEGKMKQGTEAYRAAFSIDPTVFGDASQTISESSSPEERAHLDFCLAELFAQAGMEDQALEYLRKAFNEGFNDSKRLMQDPQFAKLRKTAEFAELIAAEKQP